MKKFLLKIALYIVPIILFYCGLYYSGYLPILSDSVCYDAKIFETKRIKLKDVDVITLGSSAALATISDTVITKHIKLSYYNLGAWNLSVSDVSTSIRKYECLYHPRYVLLLLNFNDFDSPRDNTLPDLYLSRMFLPYYYLKNFSSFTRLSERRNYLKRGYDTHNSDRLLFDKNGGIVSDTTKKFRDNRRWHTQDSAITKFPNKYTDSNYTSLNAMAAFLKSSNIKLIFVQPPLAGSYLKTEWQRTRIAQHANKCRKIIETNGGLYLDYSKSRIWADSLFDDPLHLSVKGAIVLTQQLTKDIGTIVK